MLKLIKEYIKIIKNVEEINNLLTYINNSILIIRKAIKHKIHTENTSESPHSLESSLAHLKCYRLKLKHMKINLNNKTKLGEGLSDDVKRRPCSNVLWEDLKFCFDGRIRTGFITNVNIKEPTVFLNKAFKCFSIKIKKDVQKSMLKVNVTFSANFIKPQTGEIDLKTFNTKNQVIDTGTDLKQWYNENVSSKILTKLEEFAEKDSGWALYEILGLKVNINNLDPLKFGYSTFVSLSTFIKKKHAIVNVQNNDRYCFLWAVVSALYPTEMHPDRKSSYPHFQDVLRYDDIDFPITMKNIKKFEKLNNLAINLYCIEGKNKILPCCLSNNHDSNRTINLLMLPVDKLIYGENQDSFCDGELLYHFCWIKNLSRLVSKQLSAHDHKAHICERCLNYFKTEQLLEKHKVRCENINNYSLKVPEVGKHILCFKNFLFQEKVPFAIYADLESILEKCDSNISQQTISKSIMYQKHVPFSIAYYFKCSYDDSLSKFRLYCHDLKRGR